MVRHIVSWNFKPELTQQQRKELAVQVVERLNALQGQIPGLVHIQAHCPPMDSSNCDLVLYSKVSCPEDLPAYQAHPAHQAVLPLIKENFCDRRCCDF